jgi:hypothetical protein
LLRAGESTATDRGSSARRVLALSTSFLLNELLDMLLSVETVHTSGEVTTSIVFKLQRSDCSGAGERP